MLLGSLRRSLGPVVGVAGLMILSYLIGGAVIFFQLPTSRFLEKGFMGADAWFQRQRTEGVPPERERADATVDTIDRPDRTCDGFTLYTTDAGPQAILIDMRGNLVHEWAAPFSKVWPNPPHVKYPVPDAKIQFMSCHLFPNGDLLAVYAGKDDTPYGYGLVKLDKDSRVLWSYAGNVHHDVDVTEDGTIYALSQQIIHEPPRGLEFIPTPCLVDDLVLLSPQGREVKKISILEVLRDSPFPDLLTVLDRSARQDPSPKTAVPYTHPNWRNGDILHANFVKVLTRELAPKFPQFKPGQVLISLRALDTVAVLDVPSRSLVWRARGPWRQQHDPQFLADGRILVFDNFGCPEGSRVLEYDPRTGSIPWACSPDDGISFFTPSRGMSQRLPNGNTLIVGAASGKLLEVTADKEQVWQCLCGGSVPMARRYLPEQLKFLKGACRARP
jgi:hypothetical protein